jgi:hypothetical protein
MEIESVLLWELILAKIMLGELLTIGALGNFWHGAKIVGLGSARSL